VARKSGSVRGAAGQPGRAYSTAPGKAGADAVTRVWPDPEVVAKPKRRTYTVEYKQRILQEAEVAATTRGGLGAQTSVRGGAREMVEVCSTGLLELVAWLAGELRRRTLQKFTNVFSCACRIRLNEFGGATWTRTRNLPIMSRML
jgi:hypothetical protein